MRSRGFFVIASTLSCLAGLVAGYISWTKLVMDSGPVGCGADSGCGAVLSSKWSMIGPIPVSLLATGLYIFLSVVLVLYQKKPEWRRKLQPVLGACAITILSSACWFIYVQAAILEAYCMYCNIDHSLGITLSCLIGSHLIRFPEPGRDTSRLVVGAGIMVAGVVGMGFVQASSKGIVHHADTLSKHDRVEGVGIARTLSLFDGTLNLTVKDEMHMGNPEADNIVVMMFDYACPHCRHVHQMLDELMAQPPFDNTLLVVALPVPLNQKCNAFVPEEMHSRFDESCELARLGVACWTVAPDHYHEFATWLFEDATPRAYADAEKRLTSYVSQKDVNEALASPAIKTLLARNINAFGTIGENRRLPILIKPGTPMIIGRIEDQSVLKDFLSGYVEKKKPEKVDVWAEDAEDVLE